MARAAWWVRQLILSVGALLQLNREPDAWHHEPGLQPPAVVHLDDHHSDRAVAVEDNRPQVEQAPPPVPFLPSFQYPWNALFAHYDRYRRHPLYYMQSADNTAVIWAAAEEKAAA